MAHWYIGKIHRGIGNMERAEDHFATAIRAFEEADSSLFVANTYSSLGVIHGMQEDYTKALELFTESYEIKLKLGREKQAAAELNNMALVYNRMQNYRKALELAHRSLALKDRASKHYSYGTIGGIYNLSGKPDSAMLFYQKSLRGAIEARDSTSISIAYVNIGNVHYQKGEFDKALTAQHLSLRMKKRDNPRRQDNYTEIGKIYRKQKKFDSAILYLKEALTLSREQKSRQWGKSATLFLGYLFADLDQYDSAFYYLTEHLAYADSMNSERDQEIFADQRVRLETMKRQQEIDLLQAQRNVDDYHRKTLIASIAFIGLLATLFFINFRAKRLAKQKSLEDEKEKLQTELKKNLDQLSGHTLSMIHRKNALDDIAQNLNDLEGNGKQRIKNIINVNNTLEKDWENFQNYFGKTHGDFHQTLSRRFPDLTQNESRLCSLIKMDLANREIAVLLNIEYKSVKMARYRLRKKLDIQESTDLNKYIHQLV